MKTVSRTAFLAMSVVLFGALLLLRSWVQEDHSMRNYEVFTEMAYSVAYESGSPNPNFADGSTQQVLAAGVIPVGFRPFRYGPGEDEAKRAGVELVNPIPLEDKDASAQGAELYRIYCLGCHDARGDGRGPVVQRGMLPPPSLHAARALEMADGEMFHILTLGQNNMSSYTAQLSEVERWSVIRHIRNLQAEAIAEKEKAAAEAAAAEKAAAASDGPAVAEEPLPSVEEHE